MRSDEVIKRYYNLNKISFFPIYIIYDNRNGVRYNQYQMKKFCLTDIFSFYLKLIKLKTYEIIIII